MDQLVIVKVIGLLIAAAGIVLASKPELLSNQQVPDDPFKAVERRIKWGVLIGIGILLVFHNRLEPWLLTLNAVLACLVLGVLLARLIGICLDGPTRKQWMWLAIEDVIFFVLAFSYWWQIS